MNPSAIISFLCGALFAGAIVLFVVLDNRKRLRREQMLKQQLAAENKRLAEQNSNLAAANHRARGTFDRLRAWIEDVNGRGGSMVSVLRPEIASRLQAEMGGGTRFA